MAGPAEILSVLQEGPETAGTIMIVGHNPGFEDLVAHLTGEPAGLATATLAQIVLPIQQWRDLDVSTRGTLLGHWRPDEM